MPEITSDGEMEVQDIRRELGDVREDIGLLKGSVDALRRSVDTLSGAFENHRAATSAGHRAIDDRIAGLALEIGKQAAHDAGADKVQSKVSLRTTAILAGGAGAMCAKVAEFVLGYFHVGGPKP